MRITPQQDICSISLVCSSAKGPPPPPFHTHPSSPPAYRSPVTPSTFYALTPPIARFCPNLAFCVAGAPDFKPTSSTGRGNADVLEDSESRVEEVGRGTRREFQHRRSIDMRQIKQCKLPSPFGANPPFPSLLPFLRRRWRIGAPLDQPI